MKINHLSKAVVYVCCLSFMLIGCSGNNIPADPSLKKMIVSIDFQEPYENTLIQFESRVQDAFQAARCSIQFDYRKYWHSTIPSETIDVQNNWRFLWEFGDSLRHNPDTLALHLFYIQGIKNYPNQAHTTYLGLTIIDAMYSGVQGHENGGGPRSLSFVIMEPIVSALSASPYHLERDTIKIFRQTTIHELGHQRANLFDETDTSNHCAMYQGLYFERYLDANQQERYRIGGGEDWTYYFCDNCLQNVLSDSLRYNR